MQNNLIISFHDLHPGSMDRCKKFIERCRGFGAYRISVLVIPQYHGSPKFTENETFVGYLQQLAAEGHDLCLHGYYHRADEVSGGVKSQLTGKIYTSGEGEFFQITNTQAEKKLEAGLALFEEAKVPVVGFTAPAWLLSDEGYEALKKRGFQYNTLWGEVQIPQLDQSYKAPTLVYSSRNTWRRIVSKIWINFYHWKNRNKHLLRFAVHPADFDHPDIEQHIYKTLPKALASHQAQTYSDLIPDEQRVSLTSTALKKF